VDEALALEQAGVFALVLECVPAALSARITQVLRIPPSASGPAGMRRAGPGPARPAGLVPGAQA